MGLVLQLDVTHAFGLWPVYVCGQVMPVCHCGRKLPAQPPATNVSGGGCCHAVPIVVVY